MRQSIKQLGIEFDKAKQALLDEIKAEMSLIATRRNLSAFICEPINPCEFWSSDGNRVACPEIANLDYIYYMHAGHNMHVEWKDGKYVGDE